MCTETNIDNIEIVNLAGDANDRVFCLLLIERRGHIWSSACNVDILPISAKCQTLSLEDMVAELTSHFGHLVRFVQHGR